MGCSQGLPRDDDSEVIDLPVLLGGNQDDRRPSRSTTKSSTADSREASKQSAHATPKVGIQSFPMEHLFGKQDQEGRRPSLSSSNSTATGGSRVEIMSPPKLKTVVNAVRTTVSDEANDLDSIEWPERLCGTPESHSLEWTKSTIWTSPNARTTSKFVVSPELPVRWTAECHPPLPMFDLLKMDEIHDITFEIFSGMLIALADSGNALSGARTLPFPFRAKVALMHCKRSLEGGDLMNCKRILGGATERATRFVLASTDLVVLCKGALLDAGVDKEKVHQISVCLCRAHRELAPDWVARKLCEVDNEFRKLIKSTEDSFLAQRWDEFGYGAGQIAWRLVS